MKAKQMEWVQSGFGGNVWYGKIGRFAFFEVFWRSAPKDAPYEFPYALKSLVPGLNGAYVKSIEGGKKHAQELLDNYLDFLVDETDAPKA